ncbi:MAG TPA: hypothetical protein VGE08_17495 [Steroidobacter sp.]|uniref:hypothetical protein n=1 Tax=Steroidobacter sp. TaxID=1978227 RepID=UPI002ED8D834
MAWSTLRWINFRASAEHVTDGTNQVALVENSPGSLNIPIYPVELNVAGDTFDVGWNTVADGARNVSNPGDPRLAGVHFVDNGTQRTLRIDLGAARTINLHLAMGRNEQSTAPYWQILDDDSVLDTVDMSGSATGTSGFYDANGTLHSSPANWVANQTAKQYTISSGILYIRIGTPSAASNSTPIATVGIQEVESALTTAIVSGM